MTQTWRLHAADFVPTSVAMARDYALLKPEGGVGFGWQALLGLIRHVAAYPMAAVTAKTAFN